MTLVESLLSIAIVMVIYFFLIEIFTVLFRITGLTREKARFQVISMITCAGFTTSESEIITTDKRRRKIAVTCMIAGTAFNVLIISLIINLIGSISDSEVLKDQLVWIVSIIGAFLLIIIITRIPSISRKIEKIIESIARKIFSRHSNSNVLTMLDSYDDDAIVEIYINNIPDVLKNKTLMESNFKSQYNLNILMLKRGNRTIDISKDTVIQNKDQIILFGKKQTIKDLFTYKVDEEYEEEIINNKENIITLIDNYGSDAMAEVEIYVLPDILENKKLFESKIKTEYNLNVLTITRNEQSIPVTKDTIIELNDKIVVYGNYNNIKKIFIETKND